MKLSSLSRVTAAAFVLLTLASGEAFAQAEFTPTLTVTATGNSVDIRWTPISVAPTYELVAGTTPGSSNIASVTLPAVLLGGSPRLVVSAPNGGYYLRVRAAAGGIKGPWSNEAFVAVGLEPCVAGTAPVLSVSVNNQTATASWTPVPGATAYVVQWSRTSGITELAQTVTGTTTQQVVPFNGTFFVRVVAITNGCEPTTSNEAPFTINVVRRYLSNGEVLSIMGAVRNAYPNAWFNAHRDGSPERWDYIILACRRLYEASGGTVGCNFRRAVVGDLSMDGLSFENPRDRQFYFADAISGAGGSNPSLGLSLPIDASVWPDSALLRDSNGRYAPHGFANPFGVVGSYAPLRTYVNYGAAGGW